MRSLASATTGWWGIVVLFEAESLPVERLLELCRFCPEMRELRFTVVGVGVQSGGEFAAEKVEPTGAEEAAPISQSAAF